jgi:hypothetical protein
MQLKNAVAIVFFIYSLSDLVNGFKISNFLSVALFTFVVLVISICEFVEKYRNLTVIANGDITTNDESTSNK